MPTDLWLPEMRKVIDTAGTNMIVPQHGGGVEVVSGVQAIADLMLQSVTVPGISGQTYMALFPLNVSYTDLSFTRLRGKGAFVISAAWSASRGRLDGPVTIESEVGGTCTLELPASGTTATHSSYSSSESSLPPPTLKVTDSSGGAVPATKGADGRWRFQTKAGETYMAVLV
jgi:hypothetical protein